MIVKTIGRGQDNNIVVNDKKVSRTHLQMVQDDHGNISVVDLGSANGTYVNGVQISGETSLKTGDELRIGDMVLPWQKYFSKEENKTSQTLQNKRSLKWFYIAGGTFVLLLLGGGYLLLHNKQKTEEVRTELAQIENERDELEMAKKLEEAQKEEALAKEEYARAVDRLNKAKSKVERDSLNRIVSDKAKLVETANKNVEQLNAEKKKLDAELAEAKKNLSQTEESLNKVKAEKEKADKAVAEAREAKDKVEKDKEISDLKLEFYKQLNKARKEKKLQAVCKKLKISFKEGGLFSSSDSDDDLYGKVEEEYNKLTDKEKRKNMINDIKNAK